MKGYADAWRKFFCVAVKAKPEVFFVDKVSLPSITASAFCGIIHTFLRWSIVV